MVKIQEGLQLTNLAFEDPLCEVGSERQGEEQC